MGECPGHVLGFGGVERSHELRKRLRRRLRGLLARCSPSPTPCAPLLRESADRLLEIEEVLTFLLDRRVTEDPAEIRDVAPQSAPMVTHRWKLGARPSSWRYGAESKRRER